MIVPPSFLFQYQLSIPRIDDLPRKKGKPLQLSDEARVFVPASLNAGTAGLDVKLAWNPGGLALELYVHGKKLEPQGRRHDLKHSDHVQISIDTRHTANVHRATEFCTSLQILPSDEAAEDEPTVQFVEIAQQRGTRREQDARKVMSVVSSLKDGYQLDLWIPAAQMPGFAESPEIGHLGFYVVVEDTELGQLPLSIGDDFPTAYDPSTWLQLNLVQ
ncbi:MAG TPA: hypothetical protein PLY87_21275 [Planctomycetaceae bacterium]|nr:hypothetical protein [Planctomycetaceae bacterium]